MVKAPKMVPIIPLILAIILIIQLTQVIVQITQPIQMVLTPMRLNMIQTAPNSMAPFVLNVCIEPSRMLTDFANI